MQKIDVVSLKVGSHFITSNVQVCSVGDGGRGGGTTLNTAEHWRGIYGFKKFVSGRGKLSALFFNVDLIVRIGLQVFQALRLAAHDLVWGFHEPVANTQDVYVKKKKTEQGKEKQVSDAQWDRVYSSGNPMHEAVQIEVKSFGSFFGTNIRM